VIVFAVLLTLAFALPLTRLVSYASSADLHSHILLVPAVSAYLLYDRRRSLPPRGSSQPVLTASLAAAGLIALTIVWRSTLSPNDTFSSFAFAYVCLLAAGGFYFQGTRWMRAAAFPFAFLLFLVPLPDAAVDAIEKGSQYASAEAAAAFYHLAGTPLLRQGLRFELPNITLVVAQECSGIRSSLVLFITSIVAANLFLTSTWRRLALVLFVIPLGIIRNGFRVWVLGELCVRVGPHMIDTAIHHRGGPIFFALSLIPFFLVLWWLRRGERRTAYAKAA
jgi:exosortase C (VPDSG-CTERM-specific)